MSKANQFKAETDGHIAWLTMNRPEKRNTMGTPFFKELSDHLDNFDQDDNIRVVVIKAEGKSFTAGTDLTEAGSLLSGKAADQREDTRNSILALQKGLTKIEQCRKPVIAAIHSHCIGGGIDLISACDIRMATKDAIFSIRETRMGIIADLGTLQRLPYIIGHGWFRELALTGRDFTAEAYPGHRVVYMVVMPDPNDPNDPGAKLQQVFLKTSTGYAKGGATIYDVALMRETVGPDMGVKASGGVRTLEDAEDMIAAGATRIGASAGVQIVSGTEGDDDGDRY